MHANKMYTHIHTNTPIVNIGIANKHVNAHTHTQVNSTFKHCITNIMYAIVLVYYLCHCNRFWDSLTPYNITKTESKREKTHT